MVAHKLSVIIAHGQRHFVFVLKNVVMCSHTCCFSNIYVYFTTGESRKWCCYSSPLLHPDLFAVAVMGNTANSLIFLTNSLTIFDYPCS